ncbi:fidgetin-like protein 2 [Parambassis ranga]|uniref:Fidgetin-like protein 2 n=1 Tax=Parambassis ranga TaxID=210632 RepID=A0A6P7IL03_9TELE|nr:putative fidgetin-like protein 2 [Parambassis ranga]XP_028266187.1 putative fidgetin-like protein 2 [Parambassis ranga]XP_028266188.1 putative fidgetin-like protein 2 [Parambassis ranga]
MLSPIVPYNLLKMHWNPEHAQPLSQWPEQHLDVSSTTSSPAHKSEFFSGRSRSSYNYAWANDDISALTASNLLKRYAEKYSGALDSPYDRPPAVGAYPEPGVFGGLNGQKTELEPWPLSTDAPYPLVPPGGHDSLSGSKTVATSAGPPGVNSVSIVNSNLSDSGYSGSSSCSGSSEYPSSYNGTYLSSGFCPQPSAALPPASLHTLQSTPTLVPSYSPTTPVYNYPPSTYPPQTSLASSYSHPSATYLPSGLPAPTPVPPRPTAVGGSYSYQSTNLGTSESGGTLKRKAFEMGVEEDESGDRSRYRKYSYEPLKAGGNSPYSVNEKTECRGNGFSTSGSTDPQSFKPSKPSSQPLVSPQFGTAGEYSPPAGMTGENGVTEQGFTQQQHHSQALKRPPLCTPTVETMKSADPRLLDYVNGELLDCSPALGWGELAGLTHVKVALEEDLLWPVLRPSPVLRPPRTVLLFGPRGGGKTTLTRSLASQLGASFYRLSGAMLASKGKPEAEHILGSLLQVAAARQPSVVLLNQVEAMEEEGLRQLLLTTLEKAHVGTTGLVILVCATGRPDLLQDAVHRSFAKRYHVGLPDVGIRRQVLLHALSPQGCGLSERELNAVLQRTEGFSVWELLQLSQQALSSASPTAGAIHGLNTSSKPPDFTDFENAFCKVRPHGITKELDTCIEWSKMFSH